MGEAWRPADVRVVQFWAELSAEYDAIQDQAKTMMRDPAHGKYAHLIVAGKTLGSQGRNRTH